MVTTTNLIINMPMSIENVPMLFNALSLGHSKNALSPIPLLPSNILLHRPIHSQATNLIINMALSMENVPMLFNGLSLGHSKNVLSPTPLLSSNILLHLPINSQALHYSRILEHTSLYFSLRKYSSQHLFILFNPISHVIHLNL